MLDYDATRDALFHPERRPTVFATGDRPTIEAMAVEIARLAYIRFETSGTEHTRLRDALACVGLGEPTTFTDARTDTQAFAALRPDDGLAVIAFRGTEPDRLKDLLTDARFEHEPFRAGRVHGGFLAAYRSVDGGVRDWLETTTAKRRRLMVCGHSLGAALATLCAAEHRPDTLVTLGSPRVGDRGFAQSFDGTQVLRLVDCCDAITELPPALLDYAHAGALHYITHDGRLIDRPSPAEIEADRAIARWGYLVDHAFRHETSLVRELQDHAPINYVRAFF